MSRLRYYVSLYPLYLFSECETILPTFGRHLCRTCHEDSEMRRKNEKRKTRYCVVSCVAGQIVVRNFNRRNAMRSFARHTADIFPSFVHRGTAR